MTDALVDLNGIEKVMLVLLSLRGKMKKIRKRGSKGLKRGRLVLN